MSTAVRKFTLLVLLGTCFCVWGIPVEHKGTYAVADHSGEFGTGKFLHLNGSVQPGYVSGEASLAHAATKELAGVGINGKVLSGSIEAGDSSLMARGSLAEASVKGNHFGLGVGLAYDTGITYDKGSKGIEAKFLGQGGTVSSKGVEVCALVFCGKVDWPWKWFG